MLDREEYFAHFLRPSQRTARKCSITEVVLDQILRRFNLVISPQASEQANYIMFFTRTALGSIP